MIDPTRRALSATNQLLRQRALASEGRRDARLDSEARSSGLRRRQRQVQMGEVLKNQQHA